MPTVAFYGFLEVMQTLGVVDGFGLVEGRPEIKSNRFNGQVQTPLPGQPQK